MLKLEMKFDEKLIREDGKYDCNNIYNAIDRVFSKYNFKKEITDGTICYIGGQNAKDYGVFGMIITSLKDKSWFMDYIVKWLWYNSDDGENEDDFIIEDILYHYTKRESAA